MLVVLTLVVWIEVEVEWTWIDEREELLKVLDVRLSLRRQLLIEDEFCSLRAASCA